MLWLAVDCAAFELDSHYYLRFGLSLLTCFDWQESHLIASGDWGMDENGSTHAEMNPVQTRNKVGWHAFGHLDGRFHELWLRSRQEPDLELRLIKLGQFMHFLEDWEAHAGYGIRLGHARDTFRGRDPDSLGNSAAKNHRMVQSALDHLLETCNDLERLETDPDRRLIEIMNLIYEDGLLADVFDASDAGWRRGKTGGFRPEGPAIKAAIKTRIEELIERSVKPLADKGVPADFEPGTARGIPPSLAIPFDAEGQVIVKRSMAQSLRDWASGAELAADVTLSLEQVRIDYRGTARTRPAGWQVTLVAANEGELPSAEGHIEVVVIDSDDERLLAQATAPLAALQPGERTTVRLRLAARGRPEPDVIVGAFARVGDLTAMNDEDWLMLGDAEEELPDVPITTDLDPPVIGPETVRFLEPPRTFIVDDRICIMVTALCAGGDSPQKLEKVVGEVLGEREEPYVDELDVPGRWSALSTEQGLVAGKTFECYWPKPENFAQLRAEDPGALRFLITLEARGADPHTQEFPIDPDFVRRAIERFGPDTE